MNENQLIDTIEIEQSIMSGVDPETTQPIKPKQILKEVLDFAKEQKERPEILVRVFSLLLIHYDVPDKTYKQLLDILGVNSVYGQAL